MAVIHHGIHSMLCLEKATSKFMRRMSSSRKFVLSKRVAEQNSNREQEALPENENEDAMKPLSYQGSKEVIFLSEQRKYVTLRAALLPVRCKYVTLIAILVTSLTYTAGLNPPGGFSSDDDGAYLAADPVLHGTNSRRYKAISLSAIAFIASIVIVFLLDRFVSRRHSTPGRLVENYWVNSKKETLQKYLKLEKTGSQDHRDSVLSDPQGIVNANQHLPKLQLLLLLGTFVASLTYQAGMTPPGGFLQENTTDGPHQHCDGHPILEIKYHPRIYEAFFYCNATTFVASLVILILILSNIFSIHGIKYCALRVVRILLHHFWLIYEYATGSCRKSDPAADEDDRNRPIKRTQREATWRIACAAAHHMTGNQSLLLTGGYSPAVHNGEDIFVHPANGDVPLRVHGSGSVRTESIALDDVWYVPGLDSNLVSTGQLARQGCTISLGLSGCRITVGDVLVGSARFTEESQFVLDYLKVASSN